MKQVLHASLLCAGLSVCAWAQEPAASAQIERKIISRQAAAGTGARDIVVAQASVPPGARAGWHVHPGEEISQINEGESMLYIAGAAPRKLKAGDSFVIPAGVPHDAHNTGSTPLKVFAVYLVEPGKPLASPVAAPKD